MANEPMIELLEAVKNEEEYRKVRRDLLIFGNGYVDEDGERINPMEFMLEKQDAAHSFRHIPPHDDIPVYGRSATSKFLQPALEKMNEEAIQDIVDSVIERKKWKDDPHEDDYCVVCGNGPKQGVTMHPVVGINNGCICGNCINHGESNAN